MQYAGRIVRRLLSFSAICPQTAKTLVFSATYHTTSLVYVQTEKLCLFNYLLPSVRFFYTHSTQFENDCGNTYFLSSSQDAELGCLLHGLQGLRERGANKTPGRETEEAERDVH